MATASAEREAERTAPKSVVGLWGNGLVSLRRDECVNESYGVGCSRRFKFLPAAVKNVSTTKRRRLPEEFPSKEALCG